MYFAICFISSFLVEFRMSFLVEISRKNVNSALFVAEFAEDLRMLRDKAEV